MSPEAERETRVLLFESSTHIMWAEEVAVEEGIPVEVISAPEETRDTCGLAIQTFAEDAPRLGELLRQEGIPFKPFQKV